MPYSNTYYLLLYRLSKRIDVWFGLVFFQSQLQTFSNTSSNEKERSIHAVLSVGIALQISRYQWNRLQFVLCQHTCILTGDSLDGGRLTHNTQFLSSTSLLVLFCCVIVFLVQHVLEKSTMMFEDRHVDSRPAEVTS